jgi:DNA-binding SARP family transcriptional activator
MEAALDAEQENPADPRLQLSMLGTIEVTRPDGEVARPRGARLKTLLGVMVADRMLDSPLSNREFYCLAAGDDDIERARNTVYAAMYRLREIIGPETIRTDGETPQLDLERIQVNLLEAHRLLRESATAAREGSWIRAHTALRTVLKLVGREVAFPTLYDNFFEAAREEFENRLRRTIIAVGSGLLREGDAAHSEEILRLGAGALPEDEEIGELLQHALLAAGKRTEVERVKMRGAAVEV